LSLERVPRQPNVNVNVNVNLYNGAFPHSACDALGAPITAENPEAKPTSSVTFLELKRCLQQLRHFSKSLRVSVFFHFLSFPFILLVTIGVSGAIEMSCYTYTYTYFIPPLSFSLPLLSFPPSVSLSLPFVIPLFSPSLILEIGPMKSS